MQQFSSPVTSRDIARAQLTLMKYRRGRESLDFRVREAEKWWKMRHWEAMEAQGNRADIRPRSGWLFSTVLSRHADGVQSVPEANILPREEGDRPAARVLSRVIPCVFDRNEFEKVWSDVMWQKLKQGTGIYGVYWDPEKGDIAIRRADVLSLFWEPGVSDIQSSRDLFYVTAVDRAQLEEQYPALAGKLSGASADLPRALYDDHVDLSDKVAVVEWYYKKATPRGPRLHYVRYVGRHILYSSENAGLDSWYAHGQYPFVLDPLFPVEGSPCGFGYIDVGKSAQEQIDLMEQAILINLLWAARPRYFARGDGSVNEEEFADWRKLFVHTDAGLGQDALRCVDAPSLPSGALTAVNNKINELKEVTGNTDSSNGISSGSNQAASAIAALQEASGKTTRASTQSAYRAYTRVVRLVIELIRQFYDTPRLFRVVGSDDEFIRYDPELLRRASPAFDIRVVPESRNQYTKNLVNEWAVKLFELGVFDPGNESRALSLLDMMDFEGRDRLMRRLEDSLARRTALGQALLARSAAAPAAASAAAPSPDAASLSAGTRDVAQGTA